MYRSYNDQQTVKQDTLQYLQEEKTYNIERDIAEIKVYLASMKEKTYMSAVVFPMNMMSFTFTPMHLNQTKLNKSILNILVKMVKNQFLSMRKMNNLNERVLISEVFTRKDCHNYRSK